MQPFRKIRIRKEVPAKRDEIGIACCQDRFGARGVKTAGRDHRPSEQRTKLAGRDRTAMATIKKLVGGAHEQSLAQGLDDEITAVVSHITDHGVDEFRWVGASS